MTSSNEVYYDGSTSLSAFRDKLAAKISTGRPFDLAMPPPPPRSLLTVPFGSTSSAPSPSQSYNKSVTASMTSPARPATSVGANLRSSTKVRPLKP